MNNHPSQSTRQQSKSEMAEPIRPSSLGEVSERTLPAQPSELSAKMASMQNYTTATPTQSAHTMSASESEAERRQQIADIFRDTVNAAIAAGIVVKGHDNTGSRYLVILDASHWDAELYYRD